MISYPTAINSNSRFEIDTPEPVLNLHMQDGFSIIRRIRASGNTGERSYMHHIVQLNLGSPISLCWKSQGQWIAGVCKSGDIVQLLSKGESEQTRCDEPCDIVEFAFDALFFDRIIGRENFGFRNMVNFHDPFLNEVLTDIYESNDPDTGDQLYIQSLVIVCAIHIATTYPQNYKKLFALKGKLSSHQLRKVIKFVRTSIHRAVSLEELAACCNLSIFHFSRLFKSTLGVSPYQYVLRMKIECSRNLIKRKRSIADIAYSLGFTDCSHFCNAFKKFTGHSPLHRADGKQKYHATPHFANNTAG